MKYRPDIDGLRAIAVIAVVAHHLVPAAVSGGYVGVDVFFVISGFLITNILRAEIESGRFTFAGFYERRARRIFPALFAMLAVTLIASHLILLPSDLTSTLRGAIGSLLFASNVVFWRDMAAGYFHAADASLNPLLHTWSLGVEEQFYLLFPPFLLLLHRLVPRRIAGWLIAAAAASLVLAAALIDKKSVAVFFLSPTRAWELLAGSLLAYRAIPAIRQSWAREALASAGLLAILVPCFAYDPTSKFPGLAALPPVIGTAALIHVGVAGSSLVSKFLTAPAMRYIGLISYSLYLWHWPTIVLTRYSLGMQELPVGPVLIASLVLAWASYRWIERPFRDRSWIPRRQLFAASAASAALLSAVGVAGLATGGYLDRFPAQVIALDRARKPTIPFVKCDGLTAEHACKVGSTQLPTTVLWGDSHLLAWAPVFDKVMRDAGESAVLATVSACPPMEIQRRNISRICAARNASVRSYIEQHPEVRRIVLAAYWSTYFSGPEGAPAGDAMTATVRWLRSRGLEVVVFGPVPVHRQNVPLIHALEVQQGRTLFTATGQMQHAMHRRFFSAAHEASVLGAKVVDPIAWLCQPNCAVATGGVLLYRDAHHLSVGGARSLEPQVRRALYGSANGNPGPSPAHSMLDETRRN